MSRDIQLDYDDNEIFGTKESLKCLIMCWISNFERKKNSIWEDFETGVDISLKNLSDRQNM